MSSLPKQHYTPQQYLERERQAEFRSEYVNGVGWPSGEPRPVLYSHAEAQSRHERIRENTYSALRQRLPENNLRTAFAELDITVINGAEPVVVLQILSPETEGRDRGESFARHRRNPTLQEYVLLSQERPWVEHYQRQTANTWALTESIGLEAILRLSSIGCELPLSQIYARVEFPPNSVLPEPSGA